MKTASNLKISRHSVFGIAALLVVSGIVIGLAGGVWASGVLVGFGVILTGLTALRTGHLTIW